MHCQLQARSYRVTNHLFMYVGHSHYGDLLVCQPAACLHGCSVKVMEWCWYGYHIDGTLVTQTCLGKGVLECSRSDLSSQAKSKQHFCTSDSGCLNCFGLVADDTCIVSCKPGHTGEPTIFSCMSGTYTTVTCLCASQRHAYMVAM